MEALLQFLLSKLVSNPDSINIETEELPDLLRFHVKLDESDYATVIGKSGSTIKAIQDILITYSKLHNPETERRIYVNID